MTQKELKATGYRFCHLQIGVNDITEMGKLNHHS